MKVLDAVGKVQSVGIDKSGGFFGQWQQPAQALDATSFCVTRARSPVAYLEFVAFGVEHCQIVERLSGLRLPQVACVDAVARLSIPLQPVLPPLKRKGPPFAQRQFP